eukprot:Selendium_serpulae@DN5998_c0_g1_i4.p1
MGQTDNGSDLVFLAVVDKSNEVYCTRHRAARCHFSIRSMLSTQLDMYFEHGGQEVAKGKSLWTQFEWSFKWFRPQATITTMNARGRVVLTVQIVRTVSTVNAASAQIAASRVSTRIIASRKRDTTDTENELVKTI